MSLIKNKIFTNYTKTNQKLLSQDSKSKKMVIFLFIFAHFKKIKKELFSSGRLYEIMLGSGLFILLGISLMLVYPFSSFHFP